MVLYVLCEFFFICAATTDIYTYRHTLSLHDALPIFRIDGSRRSDGGDRGRGDACVAAVHGAHGRSGRSRSERRSEEHTSELQSLMRISYAVFCLNKNTQ